MAARHLRALRLDSKDFSLLSHRNGKVPATVVESPEIRATANKDVLSQVPANFSRVKLVEAGVTSYFPNKLYSLSNATSTKHIFAGDLLLATVELNTATTTASSTIRYVLTDNLGGTNVVTDQAGAVVEAIDYYPYGGARIDTKSAPYAGEKNKYAGTQYDAGSGLNYMQARYQSPTQPNRFEHRPVGGADRLLEVASN